MSKKRVVYLFGAGASQGEVSISNDNIKILTFDIAEGIHKRIENDKLKGLDDVRDELLSEDVDVEQLITLYESTGSVKHYAIARKLKNLFRIEVLERIGKLPQPYEPVLFSALIDMYEIKDFDEQIMGILTLNYDEFAENAVQRIKKNIDYGIDVVNKHSDYTYKNGETIPILKLHGSFNWKNEFPISIVNHKKIKRTDDVLWIPPGVLKRKENYPFSLLWGKAKELLNCDILRVIGCSLSRNDWELISLLYTTQKFNTQKKQYSIELIDYYDVGEKKKKDYPYLNIRTILDIQIFRDYIINSYFPRLKNKSKLPKSVNEYTSTSNIKINIFKEWLYANVESIKGSTLSTKTDSGMFEKYISSI